MINKQAVSSSFVNGINWRDDDFNIARVHLFFCILLYILLAPASTASQGARRGWSKAADVVPSSLHRTPLGMALLEWLNVTNADYAVDEGGNVTFLCKVKDFLNWTLDDEYETYSTNLTRRLFNTWYIVSHSTECVQLRRLWREYARWRVCLRVWRVCVCKRVRSWLLLTLWCDSGLSACDSECSHANLEIFSVPLSVHVRIVVLCTSHRPFMKSHLFENALLTADKW